VGAELGELATDNSDIISPATLGISWLLDNLGNWSGDAENGSFVRSGDFDGDQTQDVLKIHHETNQANQLASLVVDVGEPTETTTSFIYDLAGNLVTDGTCFYQYDAWGRLAQVYLKGTADFCEADGRIDSGAPGAEIVAYVYDGLGRLIRKEGAEEGGTTGGLSVDYYYDGSRRIQDYIDAEYGGVGDCNDDGRVDNKDIARFALCYGLYGPGGDCTESDFACADLDGSGCVDLNDFNDFSLLFGWHSANDGREYVYGPDYVDEFVAQVDRYGATTFFLQDANYNVVALLSTSGQVLEQYTWEPYGEPAAIDRSTAWHPNNRVGHQGLFFERLDATDPEDTFPLQLGAFGFYHNRNRSYLPSYGRFMQADPNGTGLGLQTWACFNAHALDLGLIAVRPGARYHDGLNAYEYVRSNPANALDPQGLLTLFGLFYGVSEGAYVETSGVLGGMSALDLDFFVEGIEASMRGAYNDAEILIAAAESATAFFATTQGAAVEVAKSFEGPLERHFNVLLTGGPNDPGNNHHKSEIKAWIDKIARLAEKRMKGKTREDWLDYVRRVREWLDNPWSGNPPPTMPT
jgi:YD repeat-containing protein